MLDKSTKFLQITPTVIVIILGFLILMKSTDLSLLEDEVGSLSQRTIYLNVVGEGSDVISDYTVSVHPKYSFHQIHPKYEMSVLKEGGVRLLVSFSNDFILRVNSSGYEEFKQELDMDSPGNIIIHLKRNN